MSESAFPGDSRPLIERLRAAYQRQKVTVLGMDVYATPLTMAESTKVNAMHPDDTAARQAEILVMKCLDAKGAPLFSREDRESLATEVSGGAFTELWHVINGRTVDAQAEK